MPAPRTALNGYRPDLGTMFEFDVLMNQRGFIGNQVAPVFESAVQSGTFGKIPLKQLLKEPEVGRDSRGNYNRTNFTFEDTTFGTKEKGIEIPIDRRQSKMYRSFFDFETVCAATALDIVLRAQEKRVADMIFNATTFAARTVGVTNEWDDFTNATPVTDVNAAVMAIWQACGLWANALIINRKVFRNLRRCDEVTDMIASQGAGSSIEQKRLSKLSESTPTVMPVPSTPSAVRRSSERWAMSPCVVPSPALVAPRYGRTKRTESSAASLSIFFTGNKPEISEPTVPVISMPKWSRSSFKARGSPSARTSTTTSLSVIFRRPFRG